MFNFLGKHPRSSKNAMIAAVCTLILGALLIALGVSIAVSGNQVVGYLLIAIAIAAIIINLARALR